MELSPICATKYDAREPSGNREYIIESSRRNRSGLKPRILLACCLAELYVLFVNPPLAGCKHTGARKLQITEREFVNCSDECPQFPFPKIQVKGNSARKPASWRFELDDGFGR